MKVIKNENIMTFDVDDTLILHLSEKELSKHTVLQVWDEIESKTICVGINKPMVRLLKEEIHRGNQVIVWSRGGYRWAASVLNALQLSDLNIIVMTKPLVYFDDKDVKEWLPYRVYLSPETVYKT
jgi:hypothetical protein